MAVLTLGLKELGLQSGRSTDLSYVYLLGRYVATTYFECSLGTLILPQIVIASCKLAARALAWQRYEFSTSEEQRRMICIIDKVQDVTC